MPFGTRLLAKPLGCMPIEAHFGKLFTNFTFMKDTISKKNFLKSIDTMPEELSVDQLFERILILQKIEQGLDDIDNGRFISSEDLDKEIEKWLK
jgi:hypothetical protein